MILKTKETYNNQVFLTTKVFSKLLYKTNFCNKKGNQILLGIDILKDEAQKELLELSILRLEESYSKLAIQPNCTTLLQKGSKRLFLECIKTVCDDFLTKKYGSRVTVNLSSLKSSLYVKNILKDSEILFNVPFSSLLDPNCSAFRSIYYPIYNSASVSFLEALLDNLILEISNCVAYFSLVNFSSVYAFRQLLCRSKFLSLRNLERFKNNLNWQLYIKGYIQRPINLYNNRYDIYILKTTGIYCRTIYATRINELMSLTNVSLIPIVFIEIGDFVTSRFDEAIFVISKGARYTLTSVFGQVIGLVWRGIIEGLKK